MLKIPDRHKSVVERIISLSDESAELLIRALHEAPPAISPRALAQSIAPRMPPEIGGGLDELLTVLISLILLVASRGKSPQEAGTEIAAAAAEMKIGGLELGSEEEAKFSDRITSFMKLADTLSITSKASSVYFAHPRLFHRAKILSDIRTIFSSDDSIEPVAGMIVHQLEISESSEGQMQSHYVAMNAHDLKELKLAVDRALSKDAALQKVIENSGLKYLEDAPAGHQE